MSSLISKLLRAFPLLGLVLLLPMSKAQAQNLPEKDREKILLVMADQEKGWNEGNLEAFMQGYWESDSLMFVGKSGLTRGWQQTLANYRKGYPDRSAMGTLTFTILSVKSAGKGAAFVVGGWHLARSQGDLQGHFSLLWRKIKGEWVIVADHSS